jgi:hypothetical protein
MTPALDPRVAGADRDVQAVGEPDVPNAGARAWLVDDSAAVPSPTSSPGPAWRGIA